MTLNSNTTENTEFLFLTAQSPLKLYTCMNPAVILPCLVQDLVEAQQQLFEEHHDFYEAQQDCEKWLLQMSFRLMAHNSLNVSSMELTERQIEKHRVGRSAHMLLSGIIIRTEGG